MLKAGVPCAGFEGALPEDPGKSCAWRAPRNIRDRRLPAAAADAACASCMQAALLPAVTLTRNEAQSAFGNATVT
jgi:hypothetical protein